MKAFIASLNNGSTSGVITPEPPIIIINPSALADKIYWWLDGVDQIGASNLVATETNIALPYSSNLKKATDLISLNAWFTGVTANAIDKNSVSSFCASRQFYNSTTKELIIVKAGQHLSASEEIGLVNYMEVETLHNFDSKTVNLFTRFTNSYSNLEKSKIDNVIRLLDRNDIYNKLDHFYMSCTSKKEEQLLDWINASTNITIPADNVAIVPLRGLAPQTGYFSTNAIPSNAAKMTVNDAFVSIKTFNNPEFNAPNYLFGATGNTSFRLRPTISGGAQTKSYDMQFFTDSKLYFQLGASKYSDTLVMTKLGSQFTAYRNNDTNYTVAVQGTISYPSTPVAFGGIIGINAQSNSNYIQHYASGAALTEIQAKMLALITDNFCEGQKALGLGYIQEDGYKVYTFDFDIKDTLGNKCLFQKESAICFSDDLGKTISAQIPFVGKTLGNIEMCHIFDNGNIIFATSKNVVYKTTWDLLSLEVLQPTKNGNPYNIHTPANSAYPGEYFKMLCAKNKQYLDDGREIFVWGNYCNVWTGASPTVVWYSFGNEIKVAYEYGQNNYYTDNGVFVSGPGGNLLGDPLATIKTRHSHGVQQSPENKNQFFMAHGDFDRAARTDVNGTFPAFFESGFTKFLYNPIADSWTASLELTGTGFSRAKSSAVQMPGDGYLYYSSDLSVSDPVAQLPEIGYFRVLYAELSDWSKHERFHLHEKLTKSLNHFHLDNEYFFMGGGYAAGGQSYGLFGDPDIIYSPDMVNYFERILPIAGNSYFYRIHKISSKKYLLNAMVTYSYANSFSVVLDFN